ncbi:TPA: ribonuclease Y [Candidatus Falkowbacteria bacterium]|nr:ribonuclease Y [Candidatus Falkowbacteria bacterium]
MSLQILTGTAIALAFGFFIGYLVRKMIVKGKANSIEAKTQLLIEEAKNKEREILLKAKDKALSLIEEAKKDEQTRRRELKNIQTRLEKREELFDQKLLELETKQTKIQDKAKEIENIKGQIQKIKTDQLGKLEKIAGMNKEKAIQVLMDNVEKENQESLMSRIKKLSEESTIALEGKARTILANVIQRCSVNHSSEMTTTTLDIPSDEMKGRIIGREGRNIRTIEQITGVEIVIDDTPNAITISGFSPIRRHVAKKALEKLILDGRIHPAKIEDAVEEAKKEIALEIKKAGEEAAYEVGIASLDPKLVQIIGRLKYRTSYGQNVLQHTIEVTQLSALLAEHLGADVNLAKKAGFVHDIGKAVDHEVQGTHIEIGADICRKFGISEDVIKAAMQHHDDHPETLEGVIVKTADSISGGRPGARKDTYERYLQRLTELENVATRYEGIDKAYAIQAGREVRVFVRPDVLSDLQAQKVAQEIAKNIESELKYPGEIKVTVIRENRIVEYAR